MTDENKDARDSFPQPMQPIADDGTGVVRFKENAIVRWMLDTATEANLFSLNTIAMNQNFTDEDRMQFAQLIGYSVSGFGELSYTSDEAYDVAAGIAKAWFDVAQRKP